jgi:hypothetical protein
MLDEFGYWLLGLPTAKLIAGRVSWERNFGGQKIASSTKGIQILDSYSFVCNKENRGKRHKE